LKYSIIICAFNEEGNIEACLNSVRIAMEEFGNQAEVIVVDNSSADKTIQEVERVKSIFENFCKFTLIKISHVPLAVSRNTGMSQARGEFVLFIDADAVVDRAWLKEMERCVFENPDKEVFSGKVKNLSQRKEDFSNVYYRMIVAPSQHLSGSKLIGANMAFRKSSIEKVGAFSSVTTLRGDEVFVLRKLVEEYGPGCEQHCKDSVVFNEFPNSYFSMLKIVRVEAFSYALILCSGYARPYEGLSRSLMAVSWVLGLFLFFINPWLGGVIWGGRLLLRFRFLGSSFSFCSKRSLFEALSSIWINSLNVVVFDLVFLFFMLKTPKNRQFLEQQVFYEKSKILQVV